MRVKVTGLVAVNYIYAGGRTRVVRCLRHGKSRALHITAALGMAASISAFRLPARAVTPADVRAAVKRGRNYLYAHLDEPSDYALGIKSLRVMALLHSGSTPDEPVIRKLLDEIYSLSLSVSAKDYIGKYQVGLACVTLAMSGIPKYRHRVKQLVRRLSETQYVNGGWGDLSRTQFVLLGFYEAHKAGIEVPRSTMESARKFLLRAQNPDGGFGYTLKNSASYGSMTCAGLAGLYICDAVLQRDAACCRPLDSQVKIDLALKWLAEHFSVTANPGGRGYLYYYLYALERVGEYGGLQRIGSHDWYREGAAWLVALQSPDGMWGNQGFQHNFALLFLGKGSAPVGIAKINYGRGWNPTPADLKGLSAFVSMALKTPVSFITIEPADPESTLARAPVVCLEGNGTFRPEPKIRKAMRTIVRNGGTLLVIPCCGGKTLDTSFKGAAGAVFGNGDFAPLPDDHPVYHVPFEIPVEARQMEGLVVECRWAVFISNIPINYGWQGCRGPLRKKKEESDAYRAKPSNETCRRLGANIIAYAVGYHRLYDKLERIKAASEAKDGCSAGGLVLGQLITGNTEVAAGSGLAKLVDSLEKAGLDKTVKTVAVRLEGDELYASPLLYLTGYRAIDIEGEKFEKLDSWLDRGGMLWIDPCCRPGPLIDSALKLMKRLSGKDGIQRLGPEHEIFHTSVNLERVEYTDGALKSNPRLDGAPFAYAVVRNGRPVVVMFPASVACGLGKPRSDDSAYKPESAAAIALNILFYALKH